MFSGVHGSRTVHVGRADGAMVYRIRQAGGETMKEDEGGRCAMGHHKLTQAGANFMASPAWHLDRRGALQKLNAFKVNGWTAIATLTR